MQPSIEQVSVSGIDTEVLTLGAGRPVVYLHPGDGLKREIPFLRKLAESNKVIAPSHPGFGNSQRPDDFKTVDDIAYFYLDFLQQFELTDVVLVGSSFGGWIACEMAIRSTARIGRLVLIDTVGARFSDRDKADIADIYMLSEAKIAQFSYIDSATGKLDIAGASDEELLIVSRNRIALCQYAWSPYMHNPQLKRWLHRIDVPVLLLWGEHDQIVDIEYGRQFAAEIPLAEFVVVENGSHYPHIEQTGKVIQALAGFMGQRGDRVRDATAAQV